MGRRGLAWALPLVLGGLFASCSSHEASSPPVGVVTGVATPCVGAAMSDAEMAKLPVRVTLSQGSRIVATQTVTGNHVYRLAVRPGQYAVTSTGQGTLQPTSPIELRPGQILRVDLYSDCK